MECPICSVSLTMSERQGIEIDYCPQCRGVWLDRGELDKLIERATAMGQPAREAALAGDHGRRLDDDEYYRHKKRRNWLEELFD